MILKNLWLLASLNLWPGGPCPLDCKTVRSFSWSRTLEQSNERSQARMKTESDARACETLAGPSRLDKIDFEGLPIVRWLSCSPEN